MRSLFNEKRICRNIFMQSFGYMDSAKEWKIYCLTCFIQILDVQICSVVTKVPDAIPL